MQTLLCEAGKDWKSAKEKVEQLRQQKLNLRPLEGPKRQKARGAIGQPKARAMLSLVPLLVQKRPALKDRQ